MKKGMTIPALLIGLMLVAVMGTVIVLIVDTIVEPMTETTVVTNNSATLLNCSDGAGCTNTWTTSNNFTCCGKDGWITDSVQVMNTTETLSASWWNVSYSDCAIVANQSVGGADLANGSYNVSYGCYGDLYENNTATRTMYELAPIGLATLALFAVLGGLIMALAL